MKKILFILSLLLLYSCNNTGNNEKKSYKDIDYIPVNFFDIISPSSPIDKIKEMFGVPKKIFSSDIGGYTSYFYDLKNAYLLIDSKDKESISVISIQSKGLEPFIKVGKECPVDIGEEPILLGKSTFKELPKEYSNVELSRDRCASFAFSYNYLGRPCSYHTFIYGSFVEYGFEEFSNITEEGMNFECSYGISTLLNCEKYKIDYIIVGEEDLIKKAHSYGEGVHCDYINLY